MSISFSSLQQLLALAVLFLCILHAMDATEMTSSASALAAFEDCRSAQRNTSLSFGDINAVIQMVDRMEKQRGHQRDVKTFNFVFHAMVESQLQKSGGYRKDYSADVLRVINSMGRLDKEVRRMVYLFLLDVCRSHCDPNGAKRVFEMMKEQGIVPTQKAHQILFAALSVSTDFAADQRKYFEQMVAQGMRADERTVPQMLKMWDGRNDSVAAENVERICVSAIHCMHSPRQVPLYVERYTRKYATIQFRDSRHAVCDAAIRKLFCLGDADADAESVVKAMDKLWEILGARKMRRIETYHILFRAMAASNRSDYYAREVVGRYLRQMLADDKITPTEETLMAVLSVFEGTGYFAAANDAAHEIMTFGRIPLSGAAFAIVERNRRRHTAEKSHSAPAPQPKQFGGNSSHIEHCLLFGGVSSSASSALMEMMTMDTDAASDAIRRIHRRKHKSHNAVGKAIGRTIASCESGECVVQTLRQWKVIFNGTLEHDLKKGLHNDALERCDALEDANAAMTVFDMRTELGVAQTQGSYKSLFSALSVSTAFATDQRRYLEQMRADGVRLSSQQSLHKLLDMWWGKNNAVAVENVERICVSAIEQCTAPKCVLWCPKKAFGMFGRKNVVHHKAIQKLLSFGCTPLIIKVLDELLGRTPRTIETYHILFRAFAASDYSKYYALEVKRYLHRMVVDDKITPTKETLMAVLSVFKGTRDIAEAKRAVSEFGGGLATAALETLERMMGNEVEEDSVSSETHSDGPPELVCENETESDSEEDIVVPLLGN